MNGKTLTKNDWKESKKSWTNFAKPGDEIEEELYWHFLGVLPPVSETFTRNGFQVGEAYDFFEGLPTYMTFCTDMTPDNQERFFYCGVTTTMDCDFAIASTINRNGVTL
jgi:hypothetical protein